MKIKFTLFALILFTICGCKECTPEDVCKSTYLADLILNAFKATFDKIENGEEYYTISHTIINTISDISGCESNAQSAGASRMRRRVIFSDDANFSNPELVQQLHFDVDDLAPGITGNISQQLKFKMDGYYQFNSLADADGVVTERYEDNNEDDKDLERSSTKASNIIHINNASKKPVFDSNGNKVYFEVISTTIRYE